MVGAEFAVGTSEGGFVCKSMESLRTNLRLSMPGSFSDGSEYVCPLLSDQVLYAFPPAALLERFQIRLKALSTFKVLLVLQWSYQAK